MQKAVVDALCRGNVGKAPHVALKHCLADTPIIEDILKYDYGILNDESDYITRNEEVGGAMPDAVSQILTGLDSKYSNSQANEEASSDDYAGPIYSDEASSLA